VAHFGVLVVRNPRCEPIGYPTGCRMLNEEPAQSQDLQMMGMLLPLGIGDGFEQCVESGNAAAILWWGIPFARIPRPFRSRPQ